MAILGASCATIFYAAIGTHNIAMAQRHDFLNLYVGGALAHEGDWAHLHDGGRQFEIEKALVPDLPTLVPFVRPPIYAAFLSPLARLPYRAAFWTWIVLQTALLFGCWGWAAWKFGPDALVWSAIFLPTAYGIANGQDCVIMLALMIVAFELAERGHLAASGFTIGLTLFKFHLLILFPLLMLTNRKWRMFAGYCAAAAAEFIGSLWLGGVNWMTAYVHLATQKYGDASPEMMLNIHAITANLGINSPYVAAVLALAVAGLAWIVGQGAPLRTFFAAATAGSLVAVPHVYGYDAAVLLPFLLCVISNPGPRPVRWLAMLVTLPFAYWMEAAHVPWSMTPAVVLLAFLTSLAVARIRELRKTDAVSPIGVNQGQPALSA